jgi:hypothetical protein
MRCGAEMESRVQWLTGHNACKSAGEICRERPPLNNKPWFSHTGLSFLLRDKVTKIIPLLLPLTESSHFLLS